MAAADILVCLWGTPVPRSCPPELFIEKLGDLVSSSLTDDRRASSVLPRSQPGSPTPCPCSFDIWQRCREASDGWWV